MLSFNLVSTTILHSVQPEGLLDVFLIGLVLSSFNAVVRPRQFDLLVRNVANVCFVETIIIALGPLHRSFSLLSRYITLTWWSSEKRATGGVLQPLEHEQGNE